MNKIDLIIDALESVNRRVVDMSVITEALTAARELKALGPVAWEYKEYRSAFMTYQWFDEVTICTTTKRSRTI